MRWTHFIFLQFLLFVIVAGLLYSHKDRVIVIKNPPASLAQWYKPENKRQVWLHNMFKLRREMQAIELYANNSDPQNLAKWTAQFSEHYLKIAEMVPEWKKKLNTEGITRLQNNVKNNNYKEVSLTLDELNKSCKSCHADYRVVTATMYRAPDFNSMDITADVSLKKHMKQLSKQVNAIKIASKDGKSDIALSTLSSLTKDMKILGEKCSTCHKKDTRSYPDELMTKTINSLEESLKTGTLKEQGENLGTLAVMACARCHGTHRISYDNRNAFTDRQSWIEIIKH